MSARINLTGKRFGAWVVLSYDGMNDLRQPSWLCHCDCGTERIVVGQTLRNGTSVSCGCTKPAAISKARTIHGHSPRSGESRTYRIWGAMHARCRGNSESGRKYYVRYGVKVCKRWAVFENFLADMGEAPDGMSIDRFPNKNGDYEKDNCRWATDVEQAQNKRPYAYQGPGTRSRKQGAAA